MEYIAVKVKGLDFFIWFQIKDVTIEDGLFIGTSGWGKDRCATNLECKQADIVATIHSSELQF
jgi:hypothetical protein